MPFFDRDLFVRRLWLLGFTYVIDTSKTQLFKRGFERILVPKAEQLDFDWVRDELIRVGAEKAMVPVSTKGAA